MVRVTWDIAPLLKPISLPHILLGPGTATQSRAQVTALGNTLRFVFMWTNSPIAQAELRCTAPLKIDVLWLLHLAINLDL